MVNSEKTSLNYSVPTDVDERLNLYCEQTGRNPSGVVRQLVAEYVEGDIRPLAHPVTAPPPGRRTSLLLSRRLLDALELRVLEEGHATKGALIAELLSRFLAHRIIPEGEERMTVRVRLPIVVFDGLTAIGIAAGGKSVEEVLVDIARQHAARVREAALRIQEGAI